MSRQIIFALGIVSLLLVSGCGNVTTTNPTNYGDDSAAIRKTLDEISRPPADANPPPTTVNPAPTPANDTTTNTPALNLNQTNSPTSMEFDTSKHYTATLKTDKGDIVVALNFGQTPNTVKNFVDLARKNFYDKTIFHRVLKGFMIQGGDPQGNGMGGPGYKFADEPFTGEYTRGTVAMANAGPNTNGSQFFIMHADYPLPKNYTIFGQVEQGLEVVDAIANSEVTTGPSGEPSSPVKPTVVKSVEITEK